MLSVSFHALVAGAVGGLWAASDPVNLKDAEVYLMAPRGEVSRDEEIKSRPKPVAARVEKKRILSDESDAVTEAKKPNETPLIQSSSESSNESKIVTEGVAGGAEVDVTQRYAYELRMALDRKKNYPSLAKRLRQEGRVLIRFKLRQDGSVIEASVVQSAAHEILNEAARKLIERIDGLKPFPDEIKKAAWEFVVPIEYKL